MPSAKLLVSWPCQKCYCIIPQWGPPQLNDKKKTQKEKSNFRRYNEIKTKCLLSLSNVKIFIKIAYVRVWCWEKKVLVNHLGLFFKNEHHHTREFLTFCMKWTWTRGSAYSGDISPTLFLSVFTTYPCLWSFFPLVHSAHEAKGAQPAWTKGWGCPLPPLCLESSPWNHFLSHLWFTLPVL